MLKLISYANCLDPDQAQYFVWPDLKLKSQKFDTEFDTGNPGRCFLKTSVLKKKSADNKKYAKLLSI